MTPEEFWQNCRQAFPGEPLGRYFVRKMGNSPALCERIIGFITSGQKTGGFARPSEAAEETPRAGDYVILTSFEGEPRCLLRVEDTRLLRFRDVTAEHTACETPAARDVETWRGIHRRYWSPIYEAEGRTFTDDEPVLFQRFKLIHAEPANADDHE
jgi:uncharacterized protein YhfF